MKVVKLAVPQVAEMDELKDVMKVASKVVTLAGAMALSKAVMMDESWVAHWDKELADQLDTSMAVYQVARSAGYLADRLDSASAER